MASHTAVAQQKCVALLATKNKTLVRRLLEETANDKVVHTAVFAECVLNCFHGEMDRGLHAGVSLPRREVLLHGLLRKMNQLWANRTLRATCLHTSPLWRIIMKRLAQELRMVHAEKKAARALLALA